MNYKRGLFPPSIYMSKLSLFFQVDYNWMMAIRKTTAMRRIPQRARGQQRVEKILAAAARTFAEQGYESATTNEIAAKARTSIGSLYQFFPNKEAILRALVENHRAELKALFDSLINAATIHLPTPTLAERVMDALAGFGATHAGFRPLFLNSQSSPRLAGVAAQLDDEITGRVEAGYAIRYPNIPPARRRLYAAITVTMLKALLSLAASANRSAQSQVFVEVKAVLSNYLDLLAAYDRRA